MVAAVLLRLRQTSGAASGQDLEPEAFSPFPVISVDPIKDITQTCLLFLSQKGNTIVCIPWWFYPCPLRSGAEGSLPVQSTQAVARGDPQPIRNAPAFLRSQREGGRGGSQSKPSLAASVLGCKDPCRQVTGPAGLVLVAVIHINF